MAREGNGSNRYLEINVAPVTAAPFTMGCWFRVANVTSHYELMWLGNKNDTDEEWRLQARGNETGDPVQFRLEDSGSFPFAETTAGFTVDTWHHACAVEAGVTDHRVFLDGANKGTETATTVSPDGVNRISIGREGDSTPGKYINGRIAEAFLYDVALTDQEVSVLASGVCPIRVRPANLKGYWPLWGTHDPEIDLSGQGNSLTVFNSMPRADHAPVTLYTPKWAASVPMIEAAPAAARRIFVVG